MSPHREAYAANLKSLAKEVLDSVARVNNLQQSHKEWTTPESVRVNVGRYIYLVRKDGTVVPGLERAHNEVVNYIENEIELEMGRLEGLRFKIAQLGRQGGAA